MGMGFTSMEARLALRASLNDMDTAVGLIFKVNSSFNFVKLNFLVFT